jgi:2-hydroxychromene-2-carboxylate isomerase
MKPALPTFYFSLRSPYSWLAWLELKTRYPRLLARLHLVPFWEPDAEYQAALGAGGEAFLYTAMSKDKHLYILGDVKRLAARRGLVPTWPLDRAPVWEVPHLAWLVAQEHGQGVAFIDRLCHARWQQGLDICDADVVARSGAALGLDATRLRAAAHDPAQRAAGLLCLQACIRDSVFGVPFFTLGREKFWGLDRLGDFVEALAQAAPLHDPVLIGTDKPHRAQLDHAGGCG